MQFLDQKKQDSLTEIKLFFSHFQINVRGGKSSTSSHHRNSLRRGLSENSVKPHRRRKKLLSEQKQAGQKQHVRLLTVNETIFYATLNHTSPQVISLYSHNLVQQCVQKTPFQPYHCHPHYNRMPNSSKYRQDKLVSNNISLENFGRTLLHIRIRTNLSAKSTTPDMLYMKKTQNFMEILMV